MNQSRHSQEFDFESKNVYHQVNTEFVVQHNKFKPREVTGEKCTLHEEQILP